MLLTPEEKEKEFMQKYDLSILIPSRNEEFISLTVEDILKNKRGKTEVIIGLDGEWADPGITDHKDVRIIYYSESIGQRAITKQCARLSNAKYIIKTDAHCAFDEGFDVKMLDAFKEVGDNVTMVPVMRNLHVFSWKCEGCGKESYQGPVPEGCTDCDVNHFQKEIKWIPKTSPQSTAYRFTKQLRFKYFPELRRTQANTGLVETMSLQGSFFMMTKEKYFSLDVDDDSLGSWGMQGSSVALRTWLSGGRVLCNLDTWYAHLFRTQPGFTHPYHQSGRGQNHAIKTVQDMFFNNKWPQQVHPLSWLLEKFWPQLKQVGGPEDEKWTEEDLTRIKKADGNIKASKGIVFYTDNQLQLRIAHMVQKTLKKISEDKNIPIVSVSLKPMDFGQNIQFDGKQGKLTMFQQILVGLEASSAEIIYFCEHDCLYPASHFDFTPPKKDMFYYNQNWWKVWPDGLIAHWDANQVSGLVGYRTHLIDFYRTRIKEIGDKGFNRSYEPGGRDKSLYEVFKSEVPMIDIRHDNNVTKSHRKPDDFRDKSGCVNWQTADKIPGWDLTAKDIYGK